MALALFLWRPFYGGILPFVCIWLMLSHGISFGATTLEKYYAHAAREDKYGVIAPWYNGLNGQCDLRVRIAAETLKRYPWIDTPKAVMAAPYWLYTSHWNVDSLGTISGIKADKWLYGDFGQRTINMLQGMVNYYQYAGDPVAFSYVTMLAEYMLQYGLTDDNHPWPRFPISVPCQGEVFGKFDPGGYIQLDLSADLGLAMICAYRFTGDTRYLEAVKHWADLLALHCNLNPEYPPWNRYANPEYVNWGDKLTGSMTLILRFLDEVLELGYAGVNNRIIQARDAGRAYLRNVILPGWTETQTWGHYYWDWDNPMPTICTMVFAAEYIMKHPESFPNWESTVRNILSLNLHWPNTNGRRISYGDVYHGAWAFRESWDCCGTAFSYGPQYNAFAFARYGVLANDEWGREIARRMIILSTYDVLETGAVVDGIDGTIVTTGSWFNIAHPIPLRFVLEAMSWLPGKLGANRENHIMRSSSVITSVVYDKGKIHYSTFDASVNTCDVLRLAFKPDVITADDKALEQRPDLQKNGYTVEGLPGGDCIVCIRHDGSKNIMVRGNDPQVAVAGKNLIYMGVWEEDTAREAGEDAVHVASCVNAAVQYSFTGNQVRLIGSVDREGGLADVYIDGVKELSGIDCWNPRMRRRQVLYYKNGLSNDSHEIKIVVRGEKNLISEGQNVYIDGIQYSSETGVNDFGAGGGPTGTQRMIFGYTKHKDYVDSEGHSWKPATEFIVRTGDRECDDSYRWKQFALVTFEEWDSVHDFLWMKRRSHTIKNTNDDELYCYGIHCRDFWVNVTVRPGKYYAKLKFAATAFHEIFKRSEKLSETINVSINGSEMIKNLNVIEEAGGLFTALDRTITDISPVNGIIEIRFTGSPPDREAFVQAIEVGPWETGR